MKYCAGCGKKVLTDYFLKVEKLSYHYKCVPVQDAPVAPVIPIRATRENRAHLEMLHELASLLSMTNDAPLVIIKCETPKK